MIDPQLGGRLELRDPASLDGQARHLYEILQDGPLRRGREIGYRVALPDGRLLGPFNPMLSTPGASMGLLAFTEAEALASSLDDRTRQVVMLAVGSVWGSGYELYAHSTAAVRAGFTPESAASLAAGTPSEDLTSKEATAFEFVRRLTADRRVGDDLYADTEHALGPQGLADVVMLAARYQVTCFVLNAYEVPVPG